MSLLESHKEIRKRLFNPPNGRPSDERDIKSESHRKIIAQCEAMRAAKKVKYNAIWIANAEAREKQREEARRQRADLRRQKEEGLKEEEAWLASQRQSTVKIRNVVYYCCRKYSVRLDRFLSRSRDIKIAYVRHIVMYLCHEMTGRSSPEIGRALERDHTTVLHSRRVVERKMAADAAYAAEVNEIRAALEAA